MNNNIDQKILPDMKGADLYVLAERLRKTEKSNEEIDRFCFSAFYLSHLTEHEYTGLACYYVGECYLTGCGTPRSESLAYKAFERGVEPDHYHYKCALALARLCCTAQSLPRNQMKAYRLFTDCMSFLGPRDEELYADLHWQKDGVMYKPSISAGMYARSYLAGGDPRILSKLKDLFFSIIRHHALGAMDYVSTRPEFVADSVLLQLAKQKTDSPERAKALLRLLSEFGITSAMYLYFLQVDARLTPYDAEARKYLLRAASMRYVPAMHRLAKCYLEGEYDFERNPELGFKMLKEISDRFPPAYKELAYCALKGLGCPKSPSYAENYFEQGVALGDYETIVAYAVQLLSGEHFIRDPRRAVALLKSCPAEMGTAWYTLGKYYSSDLNPYPNPELARYYLLKAQECGFASATEALGELYSQKDTTVYDYREAKRISLRGMTENSLKVFDVIDLYIDGEDPEDMAFAREHLKKMADEGNPAAALKLVYILLNHDVPAAKNDAEKDHIEQDALGYLRSLAAQKFSFSNHLYACMLFDRRDSDYAQEILDNLYIAIEQGYDNAYYSLGAVYDDELLGLKDEKKAYEYWHTSAKKGQIDCVIKTSMCLRNGKGTRRNLRSARSLLVRNYDESDEYVVSELAKVYHQMGNYYEAGKYYRLAYDKFRSDDSITEYASFLFEKDGGEYRDDIPRVLDDLIELGTLGDRHSISLYVLYKMRLPQWMREYPADAAFVTLAQKAFDMGLPEGEFVYLDSILRSDATPEEKRAAYDMHYDKTPPEMRFIFDLSMSMSLTLCDRCEESAQYLYRAFLNLSESMGQTDAMSFVKDYFAYTMPSSDDPDRDKTRIQHTITALRRLIRAKGGNQDKKNTKKKK